MRYRLKEYEMSTNRYRRTNRWIYRKECSSCSTEGDLVLPELSDMYDPGLFRIVYHLYCPVCLKRTLNHRTIFDAIIAWEDGKVVEVNAE